MAKAPKQHVDLGRLCYAMMRGRLALKRYRAERAFAVRSYAGNHWSEETSQLGERRPVNLISEYCRVVGRTLIPKAPRVMLSTFDKHQKAAVEAMQSWANREIRNMRLANTLKRIVLDALFSVGICKVALATPAEGARVGWNLPAGKPFAESIDLDDWVCDMHARDFTECGFMGHRYRVPLEVIRDSSLYHKKARQSLQPSDDKLYNLEGDQRVRTLGRGTWAGDWEEFEDFTDLWEVYLPRKRLVLTLADDWITGAAPLGVGGTEPVALREQEWIGPDTGPYHLLALYCVPGNLMPKGPLQDLLDLDDACNRLYRKLVRQGERQKQVGAVQAGATEDGNRIMQANDGDLVRVDNPSSTAQITFGGVDQGNLQFAVHLKDLFEKLGGNIAILGGQAPESKTATQDTMLNQNAGGGVQDMQQTATDFVGEVYEALCWYWWHDPQSVMQTTHRIPGMPELTIRQHVHPRGARDPRTGRRHSLSRDARFSDLDIQVDPYSLQDQTPQSRAAALSQTMQQMILPLLQLLQGQGISVNMDAFLTILAKYLDMPDLLEILSLQEPPQNQGSPRPAETSLGQSNEPREYIRRSLGGDTPENRLATLMNGVQQNSAAQSQTNGQVVGTRGMR